MVIELIVIAVVAVLLWKKFKRNGYSKPREKFIQEYRYPKRIREKIKQRYPHLNDAQVNRVMRGLREYFILCLMARNKMVAMPSQVVDIAWHEFILFTRDYQTFCQRALGRFLHHTPTEAMRSPTLASEGIKRAWRLACARENIDPASPAKIPLLFALDGELAISDGFRYVPDCSQNNAASSNSYCGSHIGCSSGCGGDSGGDSSFFGRDGHHDSGSNDASDSGGGDSGGCGGGGGD